MTTADNVIKIESDFENLVVSYNQEGKDVIIPMFL